MLSAIHDFIFSIVQPNVQSPESTSSKGSCSSDQDYLPTTDIPASITDYMANNYGDNYYVADYDGSAGSVDLGLEDIDEIDTNSMAIYNDASAKKELRSSKRSQNNSNQEPVNKNTMNVASAKKTSQLPNKSLLIAPSKDGNDSSSLIDADLMLNFDEQLADNANAGTSGNLDSNTVEAQNTLFDDASQVIPDFNNTG